MTLLSSLTNSFTGTFTGNLPDNLDTNFYNAQHSTYANSCGFNFTLSRNHTDNTPAGIFQAPIYCIKLS